MPAVLGHMRLERRQLCQLEPNRVGALYGRQSGAAVLAVRGEQLNDIVDLSNNGLGDSADLLLPELNEASHQLVGQLDKLRAYLDQ